MRGIVNGNQPRSGSSPVIPTSVSGVKVAQDSDAPLLDYVSFLISPTSTGCKLLSYDDYFDARRQPDPTYMLLCERDTHAPGDCWPVRFVAVVFGASEAFEYRDPSVGLVRTINMKIILRPGQVGEYKFVSDFRSLWNIKASSAAIDKPVLFRPSYEKLILNIDGKTQMTSNTYFVGGSIMSTLTDPKTAEVVRTTIVSFSTMVEGGALDFSHSLVMSDGSSLAPVPYTVEQQIVNIYVNLWDIVGLRVFADHNAILWCGLKYNPTSSRFNVVAMHAENYSEASVVISSTNTVVVTFADMEAPPSGK